MAEVTAANALGRIHGSSGPPAKLADLVGDTHKFFTKFWAKWPTVMRASGDLGALISEDEMWDELDCGALVRPYFTVFNEGVRPAISDITVTRTVVGHKLQGYANAGQIRESFAAGATFKFNQAEHWHERIRRLVKGMEPDFRGGLEAFVFLSPPDKTAMQAHYDGAHVFVLQVAGVKDWVVGLPTGTETSESILHDGDIESTQRLETTLHAGDVLYMPHGCPHFATARSGNSIHIAITVEEPSAEDLASIYLAYAMRDQRFEQLMASRHEHELADSLERLRTLLVDRLTSADSEQILEDAVNLRRQHRS